MNKAITIQRLKIVSSILFTILLWHMSFWSSSTEIPSPFNLVDFPGKFFGTFLFPYKLQIGIFAGSFVLIIQLIAFGNPFMKKRRKLLRSVLKHVINDRFNGEDEVNRITIFRIRKGFFIYPSYFKKCILSNRQEHKAKGILSFYFKDEFPHPFREYLVQYTRVGYPHSSGSSSKFIIARKQKEVSGIAAEAIFKMKTIRQQLPDIKNINLQNISNIESNRSENARLVRAYMKDGKINSIEKLKCFHRFPVKIFAAPITINEDENWGVVLFDSESNADNFEESYQDFVNCHKIISSTIMNLN